MFAVPGKESKNMKKQMLLICVMFLCLCLLCGCCGTAVQPAGETQPAENGDGNGLRLSQTPSVSSEKYLGRDEFTDFLSRAEKSYLIPGLNEAAIPQGMSRCESSGLVYLSAYYKTDAVPSVIMALDGSSGTLVAEYRLYNADGSPFTSHVGGLAAAGDNLYVSAKLDNDGSYSIAVIPLESLPAEGSHDITVEKAVSLPVSPSFLNYSQDILWVGNFYHPSADYGLSAGMNFTTETADGEYGCYILGYDLRGGTLGGDTGTAPAPDYVLVAPDRIQGMVFCDDGTVLLSQSYGRKNNSTLLRYDLDLNRADGSVPVGNREVPAYILDSSVLREAITAMPMTEALCTDPDGNVLVLFESGAMAYSDGKYRTDHVWSLNLSQ